MIPLVLALRGPGLRGRGWCYRGCWEIARGLFWLPTTQLEVAVIIYEFSREPKGPPSRRVQSFLVCPGSLLRRRRMAAGGFRGGPSPNFIRRINIHIKSQLSLRCHNFGWNYWFLYLFLGMCIYTTTTRPRSIPNVYGRMCPLSIPSPPQISWS